MRLDAPSPAGQRPEEASPRWSAARRRALRYSLIYAAGAGIWLFLSDEIVNAFDPEPGAQVWLSFVKTFLFVGVTATLLYVLQERWGMAPAVRNRVPWWHTPVPAFLAFALAAAGAGLGLYQWAKLTVSEQVNDELRTVAKLKAEQVEGWLEDYRHNVLLVTGSAAFIEDLRLWLQGGMRDGGRAQRLLKELQRLELPHFTDVSLRAVGDGRVLMTSHGHPDSPSVRAQAAQAARQGKMVLEDFHPEVGVGATYPDVGLFVPVPSQGEPLAVLHISIDPNERLYPLIQTWPGASETAETILLRRDGDEIVVLNTLRHRADTALNLRHSVGSGERLGSAVGRGEAGFHQGRDYRDVPVLAYARPVEGTPWFMVAKIDQAEAYAPLRALALLSAATMLMLLGGTAWWQATRYRDELERAKLARRVDYLAKYANDSIVLIDPQGHILDVNDRAAASLGYTREELLRMTGADLRPEAARAQFPAMLQTVAAEGGLIYETEWQRKDGSVFPVEVSSRLMDTDGSRSIQAIVRDITERKQAEARILSLNRLYAAVSAANEAIVRSRDLRDVFRAVCRACVDHGPFGMAWVGLADEETQRIVPREAYGKGKEDLDGIVIRTRADTPEGRGPSGTAYREGRACVCNDFAVDPATGPWRAKAARHGFNACVALPLRRRGKTVGVLTAYGADMGSLDEEAVGMLQGMADNLSFAMDHYDRETRRQRAEEKLRELADELDDLYQRAPCGYHSLDGEGTVIRMNDTELKWLGYTREEMIGRTHIAELLTPASRERFARNFPVFKETGLIRNVEFEMLRKDGTSFPALVTATAVFDAAGRYVMSRTMVYDMTERRKAEMERAEHTGLVEDLARRLVDTQEEERRRLSAELHDWTSPNLAAMRLNLELLAADLPSGMSGDLAARLEDLQALLADTNASIRSVCADLRPAVLDYAGLYPALEAYTQQFAARTGIAVHLAGAAPSPRLAPDVESLLFRIVQEALTNCAKHARAHFTEVVLEGADGHARLSIHDDGVGFDPDALGHDGRKPGLGLLTMKERAEFAGGKCTIESRPGQGTRIRVEI